MTAEWVRNNLDRFEAYIQGFNELVERLNQIPDDSKLLEEMPKTKKIKDVLKGKGIPGIEDMVEGNFAYGLREARHPMYFGQMIKEELIEKPTGDDMKYQIGTPSMPTSHEALAVGTAGHVLERTFFQWARKKGNEPVGGWKKDDWLQALDEGLMLLKFEGKSSRLDDLIMKSNEKGGLGWLNENKFENFSDRIAKVHPNPDAK